MDKLNSPLLNGKPTTTELADFVQITQAQRITTLALPFACIATYFGFAIAGWWFPALLATMFLSFITYGSTSHDLVHANLGLRRSTNEFFLCLIELLAVRSGHAYRLVHLHHHARFPADDDVEGAAARRSFLGALLEGLTYNWKLYFWALRRARRDRHWIQLEGIVCLLIIIAALLSLFYTSIVFAYVTLMIMGSWFLPLMTSYMPHRAIGENPLQQTRLFRGKVASIIAMEHLYHLEHHLYPSIPHHNWAKLAKRLEPYFEKNNVKVIKLWF